MFGVLEATAVSLAASMFSVCPPDCTAECCATGDDDQRVMVITSDGDDAKHTIRRHMTARIKSDDADGVGSLRVELNNDDIKAWLNNQELGDGRVKIDGGHILILSDDGEVLHKLPMHIGGHGGNVVFGGDDGDGPHFLRLGDGDGHHVIRMGDDQHVISFDGSNSQGLESFGGLTIAGDRPRIGISMGRLDSALAKHLGIDDEGAFVITDVIEGLPAHTAGLRGHDVVVRVNGESASIDRIREIVQEAGDGGPISIRVLRGGDARDFEIEVDTHFGGDFEFEGLRDFTFDHDFEFDVENDFEFDGGHGNIDFKVIQKKVRDAMEDGRFEGIIRRFGDIDFEEFGIDDVHRFHTGLREAQELPSVIMRRFGPDSGMWVQMREQLGDQFGDMDPETREMIMEKVHKAMEQARERFGGGEWRSFGDDGPSTFELFNDGKSDDGVIIFHEGEGRTIAPGRFRLRGPEGEGGERILFEVAEQDEDDDDGDDRFDRLEERLERLEKMLKKLADRLGDRR